MSGNRTPTGSYTYTPISGSASLSRSGSGSGSGSYTGSRSHTPTGSKRLVRDGTVGVGVMQVVGVMAVAVLLEVAVLCLQVGVTHLGMEALHWEVEGICLEVAVTLCRQRSQAAVCTSIVMQNWIGDDHPNCSRFRYIVWYGFGGMLLCWWEAWNV